jgi:hypothetical protein
MASGMNDLISGAIKTFVAENKDQIVEFLKEHITVDASFGRHSDLDIYIRYDEEVIASCSAYLSDDLDSLANDRRKGRI